MATCRSCGAKIRWVTSVSSGKQLPLDEESKKRFIIQGNAGQECVLVPTFVCHFTTCPNAPDHKKRENNKQVDLF